MREQLQDRAREHPLRVSVRCGDELSIEARVCINVRLPSRQEYTIYPDPKPGKEHSRRWLTACPLGTAPVGAATLSLSLSLRSCEIKIRRRSRAVPPQQVLCFQRCACLARLRAVLSRLLGLSLTKRLTTSMPIPLSNALAFPGPASAPARAKLPPGRVSARRSGRIHAPDRRLPRARADARA